MLGDVPEFPEFRPLRRGDRQLLERGFDRLGRDCSEHSFAVFYLFRRSCEPSLSRLDGALLLSELCRGGGRCLLPPMLTDRPGEVAERALQAAAEAPAEAGLPGHFAGVSARLWREVFAPAGRFERRPDADNFDYVYERASLAELPGNRYHAKRNLINGFVRGHQWEYRRLSPELVAGARDLAEHWCRRRCGEAGPMSELEVEALKEGLGLVGELGLAAAVVLVAGRVEALAIGERLTAEAAAVHFEKANPDMKGLAQLIVREFAAREFADCRYLNREQDLGDFGLRRAKESYHPAHMVEKFVVALAGSGALERHFDYQPGRKARGSR